MTILSSLLSIFFSSSWQSTRVIVALQVKECSEKAVHAEFQSDKSLALDQRKTHAPKCRQTCHCLGQLCPFSSRVHVEIASYRPFRQ